MADPNSTKPRRRRTPGWLLSNLLDRLHFAGAVVTIEMIRAYLRAIIAVCIALSWLKSQLKLRKRFSLKPPGDRHV